MKLVTSPQISEIDAYAKNKLSIPMHELISRAGRAVAKVVRERIEKGGRIIILAGRGNNGADGYATALELLSDYEVIVYDVLQAGQKTEVGRSFVERYLAAGGRLLPLTEEEESRMELSKADCIVDAIFGTGLRGEIPDNLRRLAKEVKAAVGVQKIAVDVPLGVNADDGSVTEDAIYVGATVELSFIKVGILSYPARSFVGDIILDDLSLPTAELEAALDFPNRLIEKNWVSKNLPSRESDSHKGTFGSLMVVTGSDTYRGAAALSIESALRGGVGLIRYYGIPALCAELVSRFPEVIYEKTAALQDMSEAEIAALAEASKKHSVTLIGCGSGQSEGLGRLILSLLAVEGGPLVLDADAINSIALHREEGLAAIRKAKRPVILTPHPMEFSRLSGYSISTVQKHRIESARRFAKDVGCILVLKGAGTLVTDGKELYINHTGSSALAKAGSGDVLAGFLASLAASGVAPIVAAALAPYFHGRAADTLAKEFSSFGVTPSDLPKQIARELSTFQSQVEEI
ncbi:MAG: NAD(P)H-hydrate dehydratase [Clostridia bacterium]|nr:NAD(P)H-hydrate dehydratase [Clostridia bacterium]